MFKVTIDNITIEVEPGTSYSECGPEDRGGCGAAGDVLLYYVEGQWREMPDLSGGSRGGIDG